MSSPARARITRASLRFRVTGYLKRVGERVARHLPNTGLRYEFLLYDQPDQAFGK